MQTRNNHNRNGHRSHNGRRNFNGGQRQDRRQPQFADGFKSFESIRFDPETACTMELTALRDDLSNGRPVETILRAFRGDAINMAEVLVVMREVSTPQQQPDGSVKVLTHTNCDIIDVAVVPSSSSVRIAETRRQVWPSAIGRNETLIVLTLFWNEQCKFAVSPRTPRKYGVKRVQLPGEEVQSWINHPEFYFPMIRKDLSPRGNAMERLTDAVGAYFQMEQSITGMIYKHMPLEVFHVVREGFHGEAHRLAKHYNKTLAVEALDMLVGSPLQWGGFTADVDHRTLTVGNVRPFPEGKEDFPPMEVIPALLPKPKMLPKPKAVAPAPASAVHVEGEEIPSAVWDTDPEEAVVQAGEPAVGPRGESLELTDSEMDERDLEMAAMRLQMEQLRKQLEVTLQQNVELTEAVLGPSQVGTEAAAQAPVAPVAEKKEKKAKTTVVKRSTSKAARPKPTTRKKEVVVAVAQDPLGALDTIAIQEDPKPEKEEAAEPAAVN